MNIKLKEVRRRHFANSKFKSFPGVNFINILRVRFLYKSAFLAPNFCTKLAFGFEILVPKISYKKHERKMLMTFTPAINFINVKRGNFTYESAFLAAFSTYM